MNESPTKQKKQKSSSTSQHHNKSGNQNTSSEFLSFDAKSTEKTNKSHNLDKANKRKNLGRWLTAAQKQFKSPQKDAIVILFQLFIKHGFFPGYEVGLEEYKNFADFKEVREYADRFFTSYTF